MVREARPKLIGNGTPPVSSLADACFVQPRSHLAAAGSTHLLEYDAAFPQHDEIWNGLNVKLRCQIGVVLCIYLQHDRGACNFSG